MRKFIYKVLKFILPFIIIFLIIAYIDFFKILGFKNDYYKDYKVGLNREMICTKTFNHYRSEEKFNSFIFGNSRSLAYRCKEWKNYLDKSSSPFHFDGSGDGIWGISKKIEYIDELSDTIKNALLIIDRTTLKNTHLRTGHLFISMPEVSKSSYFNYYFTFLKASLSPKFIIAYTDYSIFGKYRDYMGYLIKRRKYSPTVNNINCDLKFGNDKTIKEDSLGYYQKLIKKGVFYKRPKINYNKCAITELEINQLKSIAKIFSKHKTKYSIVISPIYDQIPMEKEQLQLLYKIFGKENVYNFSGKNKYTNKISNYYESSHYKPVVANDILRRIYEK